MDIKPDQDPALTAEVADTTGEYGQYGDIISRTTEMVTAISGYSGRVEDEALEFATGAAECLTEVDVAQHSASSDWLKDSDQLDPDKNFEAFMAWDGETEPESMLTLRSAYDAIVKNGRDLSTAMLMFVAKTYVRNHVELGDDESVEQCAQRLLVESVTAINERSDLPFEDERYSSLISIGLLRRPADPTSYRSYDYFSERMRTLKKERFEHTPEYAEQQRESFQKQSGEITGGLEFVWTDMLNLDTELEENWQYLNDVIVSRLEDPENTVGQALVNDAVRLMAKHEELKRLRSESLLLPWDVVVNSFRESVRQETGYLRNIQPATELGRQFDIDQVEIDKLLDIRPRLFPAIVFLIRNNATLGSIMKQTRILGEDHYYGNGDVFWRETLTEEKLPPGYRDTFTRLT